MGEEEVGGLKQQQVGAADQGDGSCTATDDGEVFFFLKCVLVETSSPTRHLLPFWQVLQHHLQQLAPTHSARNTDIQPCQPQRVKTKINDVG